MCFEESKGSDLVREVKFSKTLNFSHRLSKSRQNEGKLIYFSDLVGFTRPMETIFILENVNLRNQICASNTKL